MKRDELLDKLEEIQERNYAEFTGVNEGMLHTREDIADLFYEQLANGANTGQDKCHIQRVSSRFNLVADVMPARNEYVLIKTPYCKYPATVGFWNGVKWLAADDKCEIFNVSEWLSLNGC